MMVTSLCTSRRPEPDATANDICPGVWPGVAIEVMPGATSFYLHFAPQAMGRPFAAPPDIPADRKAALIKAFDNTMSDPELLADAAKLGMDIDPMRANQIDELLAQIYSTPAGVVAKPHKQSRNSEPIGKPGVRNNAE
jgi:hypothetical protein